MTRAIQWNDGRAREFGERLRLLREAADMSQRRLAAGTSVTGAYISRIESGARYPSVPVMRELADRLGVTAEFLEFGRERSLADDLLERLASATDGVSCISFVDGAPEVRFSFEGEERTQAGAGLTDALLRAVTWTKEIEGLRRTLAERLGEAT